MSPALRDCIKAGDAGESTDRGLAAIPLALTCASSVCGGSFLGFETVGPGLSTDATVLAQQFRPTMGIRFSRADGGSVLLAKTGAPYTAFAAGADTASFADGDALLASDQWAAMVGVTFVRLAGDPAAALVIDHDVATAGAFGLILDVDADETWVIRAYSDAGTTLVAETQLTGGSPGTGDRSATPWAISSKTANIVQVRLLQTGANRSSGAALDLFHPYGPFDSSVSDLALKVVSGSTPALGLQLLATPGHRYRIESNDVLGSGDWTLEQTVATSAPYTALSLPGNGNQRFYRASGPAPETSRAAAIYAAVSAFVSTLTPAQVNTVIHAANNTTQRARWSNFPTGIFQRNGLKIGSMTADQINALQAMLAAVLSPEGYQKIIQTIAADQTMAGTGGNLIFGTNEYYVSFVGTPSPTGKYLLQFGGHHLAINVTIKGALASIAPALPGVQPASFTLDGRNVRPIGDEFDLSYALLASLTSAQRTTAVVSTTTSDLALGPGKDGVTLLPEGLKASDMTEAQRAILLDLIGKSVNIIHDDASATKMASVRANIADPTNATCFSWHGPTNYGGVAYYRVQGPQLFIEWAPQSMGGSATNHIHAMYRELGNDYGALISE